ncbi:unnamed protein product [Strongylus vulgaris]|uniref:SKP1 component dimerisation domain-containing protein n=1 Tax=Strongylus vulgaris TaxID=40348 RepID=A0A3P7IFR0_STRVU|nr:unnamed protein product [Strongylus vulgaris]
MEQWEKEFFKVDLGLLFEIIMAANYLDIAGLLDSACKLVARMMRVCERNLLLVESTWAYLQLHCVQGKTPEEIRVLFNITNDFTREEEEQIWKESAWCED